jgi:hypothetical protein
LSAPGTESGAHYRSSAFRASSVTKGEDGHSSFTEAGCQIIYELPYLLMPICYRISRPSAHALLSMLSLNAIAIAICVFFVRTIPAVSLPMLIVIL